MPRLNGLSVLMIAVGVVIVLFGLMPDTRAFVGREGRLFGGVAIAVGVLFELGIRWIDRVARDK